MMHTATDEEVLGRAALYALGALGAEEARAFEEHLEGGCAACAAEVAEFSAAVEALAYAAPPAAPPASVRERLLARAAGVEAAGEETRGGPATHTSEDEVKADAPPAGFFILRAGAGEWQPTEDEGVSYKLLFADHARGTLTTLVRMEPGARIPPHRHLGVEQCLVLEGDVRSGPHKMGAGDFNCSLPDSVHQELTTDGGALLLFVAPASYELLGAQ
jgi:anti-sigma factor ChrR (cupin superfamily)